MTVRKLHSNSFVETFNHLPMAALLASARKAGEREVDAVLAREELSLQDAATLLSPHAGAKLELLAQASFDLTAQRFGRVIQLYAPLYLSNECVMDCVYCGFSRENTITRRTLSVKEIEGEARFLAKEGFRHLLLVSGEHPARVTLDDLAKAAECVHKMAPSVSVEVAPLDEAGYRHLAKRGVDGLVIYQETYDRATYAALHRFGPKKHFDWRLETPERAARGSIRRIGIGALLGLADWQCEVLSLIAHARFLMKHCWRTQLTISLPRLCPAAGGYTPPYPVTDRDLAQAFCVLRLALPDVGLVLSTRESPALRDGLIRLGITQMSAGSCTEPGGYQKAGYAQEQFNIEDARSPKQVMQRIKELGFEPVWKDWEASMHGPADFERMALPHEPALTAKEF